MSCKLDAQAESVIQATKAFPELAGFAGCWPVNDLMLLRLKLTSRREKLRKEKAASLDPKTTVRTS